MRMYDNLPNKITLLLTGALFINMRQWVTIVESRNFSSVLATTIAFFVCVWMVPLILSLVVDLSWKVGHVESDSIAASIAKQLSHETAASCRKDYEMHLMEIQRDAPT